MYKILTGKYHIINNKCIYHIVNNKQIFIIYNVIKAVWKYRLGLEKGNTNKLKHIHETRINLFKALKTLILRNMVWI